MSRSEEHLSGAVTASLDLKLMVLVLLTHMVNGEDLHLRVCVRGDLVRCGVLEAMEHLEATCLRLLQVRCWGRVTPLV